MPHRWPDDTDYALWDLDVLDRDCAFLRAHDAHLRSSLSPLLHPRRPSRTGLQAQPLPRSRLPRARQDQEPRDGTSIALPAWAIGWDVFCWIGHRRFSRHWSIPQICSRSARHLRHQAQRARIGLYIQRYQAMLAARQQDPEALRRQYQGVDEIILTIDGLQPEKGHETLYVVRELTQKRVWFAEPLLSATADEVRRLIAQAKRWAEDLGKPVVLWISDKQDAFVKGIAAEFPGVPHRYCDNHFLRDLAKPVLEADSHAKVQMRKKVRGLRGIEQSVLKERRGMAEAESQALPSVLDRDRDGSTLTMRLLPRKNRPATWSWTIAPRCGASSTTIREDRFSRPVCGWPRRWTRFGSRSNGTWTRKKGARGKATRPLGRLHRQGLGPVKSEQEVLRKQVEEIQEVADDPGPGKGDRAQRQADFRG